MVPPIVSTPSEPLNVDEAAAAAAGALEPAKPPADVTANTSPEHDNGAMGGEGAYPSLCVLVRVSADHLTSLPILLFSLAQAQAHTPLGFRLHIHLLITPAERTTPVALLSDGIGNRGAAGRSGGGSSSVRSGPRVRMQMRQLVDWFASSIGRRQLVTLSRLSSANLTRMFGARRRRSSAIDAALLTDLFIEQLLVTSATPTDPAAAPKQTEDASSSSSSSSSASAAIGGGVGGHEGSCEYLLVTNGDLMYSGDMLSLLLPHLMRGVDVVAFHSTASLPPADAAADTMPAVGGGDAASGRRANDVWTMGTVAVRMERVRELHATIVLPEIRAYHRAHAAAAAAVEEDAAPGTGTAHGEHAAHEDDSETVDSGDDRDGGAGGGTNHNNGNTGARNNPWLSDMRRLEIAWLRRVAQVDSDKDMAVHHRTDTPAPITPLSSPTPTNLFIIPRALAMTS